MRIESIKRQQIHLVHVNLQLCEGKKKRTFLPSFPQNQNSFSCVLTLLFANKKGE